MFDSAINIASGFDEIFLNRLGHQEPVIARVQGLDANSGRAVRVQVDTDEIIGSPVVGDLAAVTELDKDITGTGEEGFGIAIGQEIGQFKGKGESDIGFMETGWAFSTCVVSAVSRIDTYFHVGVILCGTTGVLARIEFNANFDSVSEWSQISENHTENPFSSQKILSQLRPRRLEAETSEMRMY